MLPAFPLKTLFAAGAETALNALLQRDPHAARRQQPLNGRVLAIDVRGIDQLWLHFSPAGVDVLTAWEGDVDAGISLAPAALPRLRQRDQLTALIREHQVDLHGDPALFNLLAILLGELAIDWEGELARYTGDVLAHRLCWHLRQSHEALRRGLERHRRELADYLTEEVRLAPGPLEVAAFCDEVDTLRRDADAIALRLARLQHKVGL